MSAQPVASRGGRSRSYADFGCRVNALTADELFDRYRRTRFLYAEKQARLEPHLEEVEENWRRGLRGGELILWVASYEKPNGSGWASISSWRSTATGWHTQHLVSTGGPVASRAVMLAGQAVRIDDGRDSSHQNWFQRSNRFAAAVFGTLTERIGPEHTALLDYELFSVAYAVPLAGSAGLDVVKVTGASERHLASLVTLARAARGSVFVTAEELDSTDVGLAGVDALYSLVGLRRYRRAWLALRNGTAIAAVVAYRGPLGFSFSFLENRCDVIVHPAMESRQRPAVVAALLSAARDAYSDLPIGGIPMVTDPLTARSLTVLGLEPVRAYAQSIWLQPAYQAWYDHVDGLYASRLRVDASEAPR